MFNYIFIKTVPLFILINLLEKICTKTDEYYVIDKNSYKKMLYYQYNIDFCNSLEEYYHESKKYYLHRELTYKSFTNIVRQICKNNNHKYNTELKYNHSEYTIIYFVALLSS